MFIAPVGRKPTLAEFNGPASVPGDWWDQMLIAPFLDGAGNADAIDLTKDNPGALVGNAAWENHFSGVGLRTISGTDTLEFPSTTRNGLQLGTDPEFTLFWYGRFITYNGSGETLYSYRTSFSAGNIWEFFGNSGGSKTIQFSNGTITVTFNDALDASAGTAHSYCLRRLKGGVYDLFKDGVLFGSVTDATALSATQTAQHFVVGTLDQGSSTFTSDAEHDSIWVWGKGLTDGKIRELADDPDAPIRSVAFIPLEAAGGPTEVALNPAVLTLTAATMTPTGSGSVSVALSPAVLSLAVPALTPAGSGTATVALSSTVLILAAPAMTPTASGFTIQLAAAVLTFTAPAITPSGTGTATVSLGAAVLTLSAPPLTPTGAGTVTVAMSPAALSLVAAAMIPGTFAALNRISTGLARYAPIATLSARDSSQSEGYARYAPTATGDARQ